MKKYSFVFLLFVIYLSSCSGKTSSVDVENGDIENLSLPIVDEVDVDKLIAKILQLEILDEFHEQYSVRTKSYRATLLNSIDIDKIPEKLKFALKDTSFHSLLDLAQIDREFSDFDFLPYYLYMGEKYNIAAAYMEIYYYYYKMNLKIHTQQRKQHPFVLEDEQFDSSQFRYITSKERDLALWSLVTAYKKGEFDAALNLSAYFEDGIFFSKDIVISNLLDSIYDIRNESPEWKSSVYIPRRRNM